MSADRHGRREGPHEGKRSGPAASGGRESAQGSSAGRDRSGRERGPARASGRPGARTEQAPSQRRRGGDPARTAAFDVLREVAESDAYANLVLPPLLRRRGITGRDAAFATELTYGTLRLRGRYDAVVALAADRPVEAVDPPVLDVLRLGVHQLLSMRVPAHAAVSETVALARSTVGAGAAQFVNAVLRRVSADTRPGRATSVTAGAALSAASSWMSSSAARPSAASAWRRARTIQAGWLCTTARRAVWSGPAASVIRAVHSSGESADTRRSTALTN